MRRGLAILVLVSVASTWATADSTGRSSLDPAPHPGLQDTTRALRLSLNLPAYRLDVLVDGELSRSYTVAVGSPDHRTPIGGFTIDRVIWNPWWIPPPFDWACGEKATPPGPKNPVGRVKLLFGPYLYLHGTPLEESLGTAGSHGCVRMRNADAIELARLVHRYASPALPEAILDSLEHVPARTRTILLDREVPFLVRYDLVEVRRSRLEIHPDVYGLAKLTLVDVSSVLSAAGVPAGSVDHHQLEEWIDRASRERVSVPLREHRGGDDQTPDTEPGTSPDRSTGTRLVE